MIVKRKIIRSLAGIFFVGALVLCGGHPAESQMAPLPSYEVEAQAPTVKENYSESRKKAANRAMRKSVQKALQDLLGQKAYAARRGSLNQILSRSHKYVRNYRYLDSQDDTENKSSWVKMEVTLYVDALRRKLAQLGILAAKSGKRSVIILIKEKSFISRGGSSVWDHAPISEVALGQKFIEEGIHVVNRGSIIDMVSEEAVNKAAKGDISAAAEIGFKTGAEIVIVGNAVSTLVGGSPSSTLKTIQANLSLKAVSTNKSVVIAAKSDFAIVKTTQELKGELAAFESVTEKLSGFLVNAVRRFWNSKPSAKVSPNPFMKSQPLPGKMDEL